jgi:hypothetical protein
VDGTQTAMHPEPILAWEHTGSVCLDCAAPALPRGESHKPIADQEAQETGVSRALNIIGALLPEKPREEPHKDAVEDGEGEVALRKSP